jgi:3,4-dihydroxy 2-butanone 4-phosphate synthase/GTP cyclohydrolase II
MKAIKVATAKLPSDFGSFTIIPFESDDKTESAIALVSGSFGQGLDPLDTPLVRIHSQCLTGEAFSSRRCDCGDQLDFALEAIADAGCGILIYDLLESRGIGVMNKLREYELQDACRDTVKVNHQLGFEGDELCYEFSSEILRYFGVKQIRLMSKNPDQIRAIERAGIAVVEHVAIKMAPPVGTEDYLRTKRDELGHLLTGV